MDAVYTWVNGSSPVWQASLRRAAQGARLRQKLEANRFREWNELLFSLRSVYRFAPWIRTIHVVTDAQIPYWLNTSHPRVRIVDHRDLFPDPATQLPNFNSLAIESVLHRIPGLSEHFLYFNNDWCVFYPRCFLNLCRTFKPLLRACVYPIMCRRICAVFCFNPRRSVPSCAAEGITESMVRISSMLALVYLSIRCYPSITASRFVVALLLPKFIWSLVLFCHLGWRRFLRVHRLGGHSCISRLGDSPASRFARGPIQPAVCLACLARPRRTTARMLSRHRASGARGGGSPALKRGGSVGPGRCAVAS